MDLLKTLLIYMTMVYVSAVQSAPEPSIVPAETLPPAPTAIVTTAAPQTPKPTPVPTPDITPNNEYKTLKVGDKGDNVTTMQRRLAELGYYTGDVDGRFGNQTRRAVERFQYYQGLQVDGIAGKRTLTVLYESDKVVYSPTDASASPSATPSAMLTLAPDTPSPAATEETPIPMLKEAPTTAPPTEAPATDTPAPSTPAETVAPSATDAPPPPLTITLLDDATLYALTGEEALQNADGEVLHPATAQDTEGKDVLYVPLIALLDANGVMVVPSQTGDQVEYAFMLDETNVFYLTYTLSANAQAMQARLDKNRGDELHLLEEAQLVNDVLYVPADKMYLYLGVACLPDAEEGQYIVYMPGETLPEDAVLPTQEPEVSPDKAA